MTREQQLENVVLSLASQIRVLCVLLRPEVSRDVRRTSEELADAAMALASTRPSPRPDGDGGSESSGPND